MTNFGDKATQDEAYRLGAACVFNKPFDVQELVSTTQDLIGPVDER